MFNRWGYIFLGFFGWSFLSPALYIFGLDQIYNGIIVKAHEYSIYIFALVFLTYPFIKGVQFWKKQEKGLSIGIIILGLVMPVVSGLFGVFIFEIIAKAWTGKNAENS